MLINPLSEGFICRCVWIPIKGWPGAPGLPCNLTMEHTWIHATGEICRNFGWNTEKCWNWRLKSFEIHVRFGAFHPNPEMEISPCIPIFCCHGSQAIISGMWWYRNAHLDLSKHWVSGAPPLVKKSHWLKLLPSGDQQDWLEYSSTYCWWIFQLAAELTTPEVYPTRVGIYFRISLRYWW